MTYTVKEIFRTLQGEGAQAGRVAVFCRFAGCNLWSGLEAQRHEAVCQFCDTDFIGTDGPGGGKFADATALAERILEVWGERPGPRLVVCTGGEPLLQLDAALVAALHARDFEIAIETNGTLAPPDGIDWICVSPKAGASLALVQGDELKVVYPQAGLDMAALARLNFRHFFVQPMDGERREANTQAAIAFCHDNPGWRLGVQTHKLIGVP
ncbi:MAG TPA: 7-carboxy-7-deazaguanine synthase [Stellaceae bacterium]|jgi:7-carboxy-7-deazaguanine synthase (Cx14CxxC type)|nr:7-carboxy-7-deazaguanine synthase [Stellaceae bacterium]